MDGRRIVGVGNIYASEALFRCGHQPAQAGRANFKARSKEAGRRRSRPRLQAAIRAGGSSLRDFVGAGRGVGYAQQRHYVYDRAGKTCRRCKTPIRKLTQGQRSTYFCPTCQK